MLPNARIISNNILVCLFVESTKPPKKKVLQGIHNNMPTIGSSSKRDYVILGPHAEWEKEGASLPIALKFSNGQRQEIKKEKFDYISRGFDLGIKGHENVDEYNLPARLEFADGTVKQVIVKVITVS